MLAVQRRGELDEDLAGELRRFRLGLAELESIEAQTARGIFLVFDRAFTGAISIGEIRAILLAGLVGGGMTQKDALALLAEEITPENLLRVRTIARAVIGVALAPDLAEDAPPKKATGGDPLTGSPSAS